MAPITRVTMIKIDEDKIDIALEGFTIFTQTQSKNGKPYIISMEAGVAGGHVKDQGFTLVTKSVFRDTSDMKFYEDECLGHQAYQMFLKKYAPVARLQMVCFEPVVSFAM